MIKMLSCATAFASACVVNAAVTYSNVSWVPVDNSYSGAFTTAEHWNPETEGGPGSGYPESTANINQIAVFPRLGVTEDYTVTMPSGAITNVAGFTVEVLQNRAVKIDGSNTQLYFPALEGGVTYAPIKITSAARRPGSVWYGAGNMMYWRLGDPATDSGYLKNFTFDLKSNHDGVSGSKLVFTGDIKTSMLEFFSRPTNANNMEPDGRSQVLVKDSMIDGAAFNYSHDSLTNILTFSNVKVTNGGAFTCNSHYGIVAGDLRLDVNLTDGTQIDASGYHWQFGRNETTTKTLNFTMSEGSSLKSKTLRDRNPGHFNYLITGADSKVVTYDSQANYFGTAANAEATVIVADGACFQFENPTILGAENSANIATALGELTVSNAQLVVRGYVQVNSGAARFIDGAEVVLGSGTWNHGYIAGAGYAGAEESFLANGAIFRCQQGADTTILSGLTSAKVGPKGLTVSVEANKNFTLAQALEDASATEGGELTVLSRDAYPLVLSANSTVSKLTVAAGTAKLAVDVNHNSYLTVTNGAKFSLVGGATTATLKGLSLGDATTVGKLALKAGDVVTVNGPIVLTKAELSYSTTLAAGTYTVFETTVKPSAALIEQWELFGSGYFTAGLPPGYNRFSVVRSGDTWRFQIEVGATRPAMTDPTTWQGGSSAWGEGSWSAGAPGATSVATFAGATPKSVTVADRVEAGGLALNDADGYTFTGGTVKISDAVGANLAATAGDNTVNSAMQLGVKTGAAVSDGATLTLNGAVKGGGFEKTGSGKLTLGSEENLFTEGLALNGGWLTLASPAALGYMNDSVVSTWTSGTLEFLTGGRLDVVSALNGNVVFKPEEDVTMKLPTVTAGAIVKRGAGRMAFETSASKVTLSTAAKPDSSWTYDAGEEISYPADGSTPTKHSGIHVSEGELVLRGTGSAATVLTIANGIALGMPTADHSGETAKQPGVVLDHVTGASVTIPTSTAANQFVTDPYIVVTNGASLESWGSVPVGMNGLTVYAEHGTLGNNPFNYSGRSDNTNRFLLVNSAMRWYRRVINGSTILVASNSVYASQNDFDLADRSTWKTSTIAPEGNMSAAPYMLDLTFAAGSIVMCDKFRASSARTFPVTVTFDDAEYFPGTGDATLMTDNLNIKTVVKGVGLKLYPLANKTWNFITPVTGEGGLVVAGEGTVRFDPQVKYGSAAADPVTLDYTGLTDIRSGALVVSDGALSNVVGRTFKVAGTLDMSGQELADAVITTAGGTIRNATLKRTRFMVGHDGEGAILPIILDYANGLTTVGRTVFDFGVTTGTPYAKGTVFTVARWTGSQKPDVSRFRGENVGGDFGCRFVAKDDGSIEATVASRPGFVMIVR